MSLLPGAQPWSAAGGPVGVLVLHGFTGTPQSVRPWAEHLAAAGFTVEVPLLPGHGTRWQDMARTRWPDWYAAAEAAFDDLRARCDEVFVCGLSMGGALALRLAEQRGADVAGLVVVNASLGTDRKDAKLLPVLRHVVPAFPGIANDIAKEGVREVAYAKLPLQAAYSLTKLWEVTCADLARITSPVLVYRSRVDHVVPPVSGEILMRGATNCAIEERVLERSYHVATLDHDASEIFRGTVEFLDARSTTAFPLAGTEPVTRR